MRLLRLVGIGLLILATGCAAVIVDRPIGEAPVRLESERWEGSWLHGDGTVEIAVEDAEAGILSLAWVDGHGESATLESTVVHLRHAGDRILASTPVPDAAARGYLWALLIEDGERLVLLPPDVDRVRGLVEDGSLPGRVDGDDVSLSSLGPEHLQLIVGHERGFLFDLDEPLVLWRVAQ